MELNHYVWKILAENNYISILKLKDFLDLENEYLSQQILLLTSQYHIYRLLYNNEEDFEHMDKDLIEPLCDSNISISLLDSLNEIRNSNKCDEYDYPLTYILFGFAYLKYVEYILLNSESENGCISINLCKAREYFEKSEDLISRCNNTNNNLYKYLPLWGKGICNYFNSFVVKDERMKIIFIKKSNKQLLEAFHYFSLSDEENERFPFIGDPLIDMSPFYIGALFERIGEYNKAEIFIKLSLLENNIPIY